MGTNLTMTRGDTRIFDGSATLDGDPYDLTNCTMKFTAKEKFTDIDDDAIFQKTTSDGITIVNAETGLFTVEIEPADTDDVEQVKTILFWDLQLTDANSKIYTMASGKLIIEPDVTMT